MSEQSLSAVIGAMTETEAGLTAAVPENWAQGRTAYGGFTAALLLAAARHGRADLPPLRSALINFTGPLSAPPRLTSELLRQGRNVTTIDTRAWIGEAVAAQGVFSFGAAQDSHVRQDCPAPAAPAPEDTPPFFPPEMTRLPARFFGNFDLRRIEGSLPFAGAARGHVRVWARHRDPALFATPEGLIGIADMLPPAVFMRMRRVGANSSMTWICNVMQEDLTTRDGWWMMETDLTAAANGYSSQVMRVWNTDGDLVVDGMQSVVVFA